MKIELKKKPIEVPFPKDPSFVVTVRRLSAMESYGIQQRVREVTIREPEIHPITGEAIFNASGDVAHRREGLPPDEIVSILKSIVMGWHGLEIDDVSIPYSGDPAVLLEDDFAYQTDVEVDLVDSNGKKVLDSKGQPKKVTKAGWVPFWSELLEISKGNKATAAEKVAEEQAGKV